MLKKVVINGIQVASIDTALCEQYLSQNPGKSLSQLTKSMMEETFHHPVETKEDLNWINDFLEKRCYAGIADWLKAMMRMKILFPDYISPFANEEIFFMHKCGECIFYEDKFCNVLKCSIDPNNRQRINNCFIANT